MRKTDASTGFSTYETHDDDDDDNFPRDTDIEFDNSVLFHVYSYPLVLKPVKNSTGRVFLPKNRPYLPRQMPDSYDSGGFAQEFYH